MEGLDSESLHHPELLLSVVCSDSELLVQVQGPRPDNVLFLIHEVLEGLIAESFQGVKWDCLIPCPDCVKKAVSTDYLVMNTWVYFILCHKYFRNLHQTNTIVFTIISAIKRTLVHLSIFPITKVSLLGFVIYSSTLHCYKSRPVQE